MPKYTELPPEHRGELELARQLEGMQDRQCHMWFALGFLPGVKDIDLLLLHEEAGLFVIEVKAVPLEAIKSFGLDVCEIDRRGRDKSPQLQAYDSSVDLRQYLRLRVNLPFVVATVCWPRIGRRHWNEAFRGQPFAGEFAERMLFQEDVTGGPETLRSRLKVIYAKPPIRGEPFRPFSFDRRLLDQLRAELRPEAKPRPVESDLQRLRAIEREVTGDALRQAPADGSRKLVYSGHPGTGKTFRLLQIGHRHAMAGQKVLLVCFNKVLATDLRRLMSFSTELPLAAGSLEIRDAFELLVGLSTGLQIAWPEEDDHDEWAEMVVSELCQRERGGLYDTVLVDEGQDMRDWAFTLAEWLAREKSTIAVAVGRGQELYGQEASWLGSFRQRAREHPLRRNFRNTRPVFRLAQTIYEAGLDVERIDRFGARFQSPSGPEQLDFLRDQGDTPQLRYVDDSPFQQLQPTDPAYAQVQHETMVAEYKRVIAAELEHLGQNKWPMDVLVLVPCLDSERTWALDAIQQLRGSSDYIDYTDDKLRRVPARPTQIRLCTYHSARGIEGSTVIILGLEHIGRVAEKVRTTLEKLAYIALSRSVAQTVIVFPRSRARSQAAIAIERALSVVQREQRTTSPDEGPGASEVPSSAEASDALIPSPSKVHQWRPWSGQTLRPGAQVRHQQWGAGTLVMQLPASGASRLIVDFAEGTRSFFVPPESIEI